MNEKQIKNKLEKEGSQEGYCKSCGKNTIITNEKLCSECYLTKGKGWK
jgi:protein-arginine kinase activator protein McsA